MSSNNRVVWSEGLFLRPQHFQQQTRYFERYVEGRGRTLRAHSWGLSEFEIERDLLGIEKGVPSGNTPAARRKPNLPMPSRSRSISNSLSPQE